MRKSVPFFLFAIIVCFIASVTSAWSGIIMRVSGTVLSVDTTDPKNPEILLLQTGGAMRVSSEGTQIKTRVLTVQFPLTPEGCIDWSDPTSREKALVFALTPGNRIEAKIGSRVISLKLVSITSEEVFTGWGKIQNVLLSQAYRKPEGKTPVIILLKGHKDLEKRIMDTKTGQKARKEIKTLQQAVMQNIPKTAFAADFMMENTPIITGQATVEGLRILAASPHVESIEADMEMKLENQTSDEGAKR